MMLDSERTIVKQKSRQGNVLYQHKPQALQFQPTTTVTTESKFIIQCLQSADL